MTARLGLVRAVQPRLLREEPAPAMQPAPARELAGVVAELVAAELAALEQEVAAWELAVAQARELATTPELA